MANHYRVSPKYWLWARRRGLDDAQTNLGLYLLTCTHRNLEGLYRLPKPYVAADLAWPLDKVETNLEVVLSTGFAMYDDAAEMVLIAKALKHQSPSTKNQITGAINQLRRIPRTSLWDAFRVACELHCPLLAEAIETEWPSHSGRMEPPARAETVAAETGRDETVMPSECDADAIPARSRADAHTGPSSNSNSNSNPPLAPPQAGGNRDVPSDASQGTPKNSRAHGTNPRAQAAEFQRRQREVASRAAVAALDEPNGQHREQWEQFRSALRVAVPEVSWDQWLTHMTLAAVDGSVLVADAPEHIRSWIGQRFGRAIDEWAKHHDVEVRIATAAEHEGFDLARSCA